MRLIPGDVFPCAYFGFVSREKGRARGIDRSYESVAPQRGDIGKDEPISSYRCQNELQTRVSRHLDGRLIFGRAPLADVMPSGSPAARGDDSMSRRVRGALPLDARASPRQRWDIGAGRSTKRWLPPPKVSTMPERVRLSMGYAQWRRVLPYPIRGARLRPHVP